LALQQVAKLDGKQAAEGRTARQSLRKRWPELTRPCAGCRRTDSEIERRTSAWFTSSVMVLPIPEQWRAPYGRALCFRVAPKSLTTKVTGAGAREGGGHNQGP
jgi:hypothetical protein